MAENKRNEKQPWLAWIYDSECEEYYEALYLCAEAERKGEPIAKSFTQVLQHRANCISCTETYNELLFLLRLEATNELVTHESSTPADVAAAPMGMHQASSQAARQVQTPLTWAIEQIENGMSVLISLAALFSTPTNAWATRGQTTDNSSALPYKFTAITGDSSNEIETEIHLTLLQDERDPQKLVLEAEVNIPAHWPDFSGIPVVLHKADGQIRRLVTSTQGIVRFSGITLADLSDANISVEVPRDRSLGS